MFKLIFALLLAFWPIWQWYVARMADGSDEPWGVVALATALLLIFLRYRNNSRESLFSLSQLSYRQHKLTLILLSLGLLGYLLLFNSLSPLPRAIIAVTLLAFLVQRLFLQKFELAIFALLILSLPIISSLQFYGGYPLRALSSIFSAEIISLLGYPTEAQGTVLYWAGEVFSIDAPCSGIKMLWTGLFANFTLAVCLQANWLFTMISYWFACLAIFITNLLRVTFLFFTESRILILPDFFHELAGLISFLLALFLITAFQFKLKNFKLRREV